MINKLLWVLAMLTAPCIVQAQIEFNGTLDLEVAKGGEDSRFISNEIASEFVNPHFSIAQFNLFAFSPITETFFFNGRIQWDTWGTGKLNAPKVTLASLTWEPEDSDISLSLGRFISPFGLYPRRILAADNLFAHAPLAYGYFINISDRRGYWRKAGNSGIYGSDDVGLTTVYFGGYATGATMGLVVVPETFNIDIAVTNSAITSQANYTNLANLGGVVRLGFQPVIYWQQGISFGYGSFMQRDGINSIYDDLEQFTQMLAATDLVLAHSYFELSGEFIYAQWNVPFFTGTDFVRSGSRQLQNFNLTNYSAYVDFKIEPPFLTGMYIAGRYDILRFPESNDLKKQGVSVWDNDITRYSVALGYKFARPVLLKLVYMDQQFDDLSTDADDYAIKSVLTISF